MCVETFGCDGKWNCDCERAEVGRLLRNRMGARPEGISYVGDIAL